MLNLRKLLTNNMQDRGPLGQLPEEAKEGLKKEVKKTFKSFISQITGKEGSSNRQDKDLKKQEENQKKDAKSPEEQARLAKIRAKLHREMISPHPQETPRPQEEDNVGTNETAQQFGKPLPGQQKSGLGEPSLPSSRRVERLKIRE